LKAGRKKGAKSEYYRKNVVTVQLSDQAYTLAQALSRNNMLGKTLSALLVQKYAKQINVKDQIESLKSQIGIMNIMRRKELEDIDSKYASDIIRLQNKIQDLNVHIVEKETEDVLKNEC
jgi:hypothetical protein